MADRLLNITDKLTWCPNRNRGVWKVKMKTKTVMFQDREGNNLWFPGIHQLHVFVGKHKQGKWAEAIMRDKSGLAIALRHRRKPANT